MEILKAIGNAANYLAGNPIFQIIMAALVIGTAIRFWRNMEELEKMNKENLVIRLPEEVKEALADAAYIAGSTMSQKAREYIMERLTEEGHLDKRERKVEK